MGIKYHLERRLCLLEDTLGESAVTILATPVCNDDHILTLPSLFHCLFREFIFSLCLANTDLMFAEVCSELQLIALNA